MIPIFHQKKIIYFDLIIQIGALFLFINLNYLQLKSPWGICSAKAHMHTVNMHKLMCKCTHTVPHEQTQYNVGNANERWSSSHCATVGPKASSSLFILFARSQQVPRGLVVPVWNKSRSIIHSLLCICFIVGLCQARQSTELLLMYGVCEAPSYHMSYKYKLTLHPFAS